MQKSIYNSIRVIWVRFCSILLKCSQYIQVFCKISSFFWIFKMHQSFENVGLESYLTGFFSRLHFFLRGWKVKSHNNKNKKSSTVASSSEYCLEKICGENKKKEKEIDKMRTNSRSKGEKMGMRGTISIQYIFFLSNGSILKILKTSSFFNIQGSI